MSLKLVIAEKPSVAASISKVLGATSKKDGYYEGSNYVVSWCVGHLLGLAPPATYDAKYEKWNIADLPILPESYKYEPSENTKKQLSILKELLKRTDITTVVNACDAGREGELIFRLVYDHVKCKKTMERLWISSLEESAIKEGFQALKSGSEYDNLHHAALCRSQADWAVGMNYSRLFSCLYNGNISIGRVQTPTLAMIVERELKIANFNKEPHYTVTISNDDFSADREKISDKTEAENIRGACDGQVATIKTVTNQRKTVAPQKLYDLTTLQREANRMFGYTAADTLKAAQNLYEQKILTYPRTDSRFISEDMLDSVYPIMQSMVDVIPFPVEVIDDLDASQKAPSIPMVIVAPQYAGYRQIVNNAKVTDHHAIIPTLGAASTNIDSLPQMEKDILLLVCVRFISAISIKHEYAETTIVAECNNETFTTKGKTIVQNGWKAIEQAFAEYSGKKKQKDSPEDEKSLPILSEGQQLTVSATVREGFSQPPKHYTEDLLLSAMETAGKEDMPDDVERKGIGTPATRAETIETLLKKGYVIRKDKQILPTEKGYSLIKVIPDHDFIKSPLLTAEWESDLKKVETGAMSANDFMDAIHNYVASAITTNSTALEGGAALANPSTNTVRETIGKCPRCANDVAENKKGFGCVNRECKFVLWKENAFFVSMKKEITKTVATKLLKDGRVAMKDLYSKKSDKTFDATIVLADNLEEGRTNFTLDFAKK